IEINGEIAALDRYDAAYDDVVLTGIFPISHHYAGGLRRSRRHLPARQGLEPPAALEVVLDHLGDIEPPVRGDRAREWHDRDRHRIAHPGGDLDPELRGGRHDRTERQYGACKVGNWFVCSHGVVCEV